MKVTIQCFIRESEIKRTRDIFFLLGPIKFWITLDNHQFLSLLEILLGGEGTQLLYDVNMASFNIKLEDKEKRYGYAYIDKERLEKS